MLIRFNWLRVCLEKWRLVHLIIAMLIVLSCSQQANAGMRFIAGVAGLFDKQTATITQPDLADINLIDDLNISKNVSLYEVNAGVYSKDLSIRGYWLQNRNSDGVGMLREGQFKADKKDKKKLLPVNSTFGFRASRVELGLPYVNATTVIEPFGVISTVNTNLSIQGDKLNLDLSNNKTGAGAGITFIQKASVSSNVTFKAYATNVDNMFEVEYVSFTPSMFWKAGYSWRQFSLDNINLKYSGPKVEVGVTF